MGKVKLSSFHYAFPHIKTPAFFQDLTLHSIKLFCDKSSITARSHAHCAPRSNSGRSPNPVFPQPARALVAARSQTRGHGAVCHCQIINISLGKNMKPLLNCPLLLNTATRTTQTKLFTGCPQPWTDVTKYSRYSRWWKMQTEKIQKLCTA